MIIKENIDVDGKRNIQTKVMTASRLDSKEGEIRHFLEPRVSKTAIAKLTSMVDIPRSDRRQPPASDVGDPPRVLAPKTLTRRGPESPAEIPLDADKIHAITDPALRDALHRRG